MRGLLSKEYARERAKLDQPGAERPGRRSPAIPYPFQGETNPFRELLRGLDRPRANEAGAPADRDRRLGRMRRRGFYAGTTSIEAADAEGWVVSVTPSGGWVPAVIAGRTGIGLSQRMQSFVLDPAENPVQRARAGQAPARDAHADAGAEGRPAVSRLRGAGRRQRRTRTCCSSS